MPAECNTELLKGWKFEMYKVMTHNYETGSQFSEVLIIYVIAVKPLPL